MHPQSVRRFLWHRICQENRMNKHPHLEHSTMTTLIFFVRFSFYARGDIQQFLHDCSISKQPETSPANFSITLSPSLIIIQTYRKNGIGKISERFRTRIPTTLFQAEYSWDDVQLAVQIPIMSFLITFSSLEQFITALL